MKKIIIILLLINISSIYGQDFYKIPQGYDYTSNNINLNKGELFIVLADSEVNDALLQKCEIFCDNLQSSINNKYIEHTYTFYRKTSSISETSQNTFEDIVTNHKNDIVAILKYQKNMNGSIDKIFLLLKDGQSLKCLVNGVQKTKIK